MRLMSILMSKLKAGDVLETPIRRKKFNVESISPSGITLMIGKGWRTPIPAECWDGIPNFLKGKGWVEIRGKHLCESEPGTLEYYLNKSKPQSRSTSNYVAPILEHAGIVEIDRKLPSKVRLII